MRDINKVIIHCSDSDYMWHDNIDTIREWHVKERGWSDIGYHYVITQDGSVQLGRPIERSGAHVRGQNDNSIGICLTGKKFFTCKQFESLRQLISNLKSIIPGLNIHGHRDFDPSKTCPNFNVFTKLDSLM